MKIMGEAWGPTLLVNLSSSPCHGWYCKQSWATPDPGPWDLPFGSPLDLPLQEYRLMLAVSLADKFVKWPTQLFVK